MAAAHDLHGPRRPQHPEYLDRDIFPHVAARMMWFDYIHIMGGRIDPATVRGSMRLLAGIFHVSPAVRRQNRRVP